MAGSCPARGVRHGDSADDKAAPRPRRGDGPGSAAPPGLTHRPRGGRVDLKTRIQTGTAAHLEGAPCTCGLWASTIHIVAGQEHFSGQRHGPPKPPPCRVGGWRGAAVLAARFQPPPVEHAILPHTAHRRRSPPAFGVTRQARKGLGAATVPVRSINPRALVEAKATTYHPNVGYPDPLRCERVYPAQRSGRASRMRRMVGAALAASAVTLVALAAPATAQASAPPRGERAPTAASGPSELREVFSPDGTITRRPVTARAPSSAPGVARAAASTVTAIQQTGASAQRFDLVLVGDGTRAPS